MLEEAVRDARGHAPALLPDAMNLFARANQGLGRYAIAEEWYRRAIAGYEAMDGRDPRIAVALANLLSLHVEQGRPAPGRRIAERLERWTAEQLPVTPDDCRHFLSTLAGFRVLTGEEDRAEKTLLRALAIPGGKDLALEAAILNDLGSLSAQTGRSAKATAYFIEAIDRLERGLGREHPSQVQVLQNLSMSYQGEHRLSEALAASRRALSLAERTLPEAHPLYREVMLGQAELLRKCGQKREAKQMEARARDIRVEGAGEGPPPLVDVTELRARRH